jgi:formylglycine-generating enzyme required for sulfatase activity/dienelactone hydrolase/tRNA A-37 threonylcarbamoyl transferase component Bud32
LIIGETISHYRVVSLLGAGGMGEVYKAEDTRLKRAVALKFLPLALVRDRDAKQRLLLEAQAASALDHPNICTIHEIDETADGRVFLAMAYYDGETLKQRIERGAVSIEEAIDIIVQVARGVAAAHDPDIIHRDIKPANILICSRGSARAPVTGFGRDTDTARVKLLDFGIAKLSGQTAMTRTGTTIGTVAYMSPEQITGQGVDARTDVWSLGVVFYELLAGRTPFARQNELAIIRAIADEQPPPLGEVRPDVPGDVQAIVGKALQKDVAQRYASAHEFLHDVEALRSAPRVEAPAATVAGPTPSRGWSHRTMALASGALLVVAVAGAWFISRAVRGRRERLIVPEIRRLVETEQYAAAFRRVHTAPATLATDPEFVQLQNAFFLPLIVRTDPPGARIYAKGYGEPDAEWVDLGPSPLETRGTQGYFRWRLTKTGYETVEGAAGAAGALMFTLAVEGTAPEGMVRVSGGNAAVAGAGTVRVPAFFIDKYEVTNKGFKRFVDAGGYRTASYWQQPFVKAGRTLTFDEAVAELRDTTGRPGPAAWELGTYPDGQDDFPVGGVSWYEADAYARFAGKALPTVHHWRIAAGLGLFSDILEWSNFSGKAVARAGQYKGIGPYGTYDMAGNVKEWCANAVGERRYILGGGWNEPNYQFRSGDARAPFDRSANNGIRLIKLPDPSAVPAAALKPIERIARDYSREKPVSDELFEAFKGLYSYDAADLKPTVEPVNDGFPSWRVERVSYAAAYGNERIIAYLFLPKNASPPYQTVVYFPHSGGLSLRSFEQAEMSYLGFIIKAGRALLLPMYKGTYERRIVPFPTGRIVLRDLSIAMIKDLGRSVDYLQTRSDIDHNRLAYFGVSMGAAIGPVALAVEKRFKTAVLWSGGFATTPAETAEDDPFNFAPRVTTPVLMLNGRDDFTFPVETSQAPMFQMLGTPPADKRRVEYPGGHIFPFARMIKDTLDWLDKYLGVP